ncbi:MAG TPA: signal peptide peptidase SppA [Nanoarchaeota archaeon]|nr:MAG: protease IV [archaeon GW2011_AR6]MBS3082642.1 signal peptide peptidase SppA [Candidatus Pacearchaeota archaeon]HIH17419.1 signal peptide peptidase SppA [Nanoarchaeota archaeon]HIH34361.1 signal peptide peptidase SppA [Nanoarchaeota archaeon]HIH51887.1 signal peptide peptidase SppA [Nanoarchaeota archaeon]
MIKGVKVQAEKKEHKWKIGTIILLFIILFFVLMALSSLKEAVTDKVLVVPIEGTISNSDEGLFLFGQSATVPHIVSCLERAEEDETVKAVLLDINSPGGTVIGSQNVADKISRVREKKPVVAFINEVGASGGYWIASGADKIVAEPFSITGSIGVTSSYLGYGGLLNNFNITYERLVTGEFKDIGTPYKDLTEKEERVLMVKLNMIHEEFVNVIAENRGMKKEDVEEIANGLFYLGKEAKDLGLVDELGNRERAENVTKELAGDDELLFVECKQEGGFFSGPSAKMLATFGYYVGKGMGDTFVKSDAGSAFQIR